jgi:hypothetical protein
MMAPSSSNEKTPVPFEDFLKLLQSVESEPVADVDLLDQIMDLWEKGLVVLTLEQAAEVLALREPQLEALLDATCFSGAYRDNQGTWQLPLDAVLAQHEKQSLPQTRN